MSGRGDRGGRRGRDRGKRPARGGRGGGRSRSRNADGKEGASSSAASAKDQKFEVQRIPRRELFRSVEDFRREHPEGWEVSRNLAYSVYSDLAMAQAWDHVIVRPIPSIENYMILARETPESEVKAVFIVTSESSLSVEEFMIYFDVLKTQEDVASEILQRENPTFELAIVDSDSTVVYYTCACGLVEPQIDEEEVMSDDDEGGALNDL